MLSFIQFSHSVMSNSFSDPMDCSTLGLPVHHQILVMDTNSCPFSWWCHPTISSSFCPLLLPPSIFPSFRVFFNESALQIWCQSIGASASASVLPMNIQGWFPLGLTGLISLLSSSVQFSHSDMSDSLQRCGLQHARLFCPPPTPRACSNSCPWSLQCHPTLRVQHNWARWCT